MRKGRIKLQFKNFAQGLVRKTTQPWHCVATVVFAIQILLIFGCCNRYFWDIQLKIYRLPNAIMLFHFPLTKFSKSELPKVYFFPAVIVLSILTTVLFNSSYHWVRQWGKREKFCWRSLFLRSLVAVKSFSVQTSLPMENIPLEMGTCFLCFL